MLKSNTLYTVYGNSSNSSISCKFINFICNLYCKFSCRNKYQCLYRTVTPNLNLRQYWQGKCCCLTSSCVRLTYYVYTFQNQWYSCLLNRERFFESVFF